MEYTIAALLLLLGLASTGWLAIVAIAISVISTVYSYTVAQKAGKASQDGVLITKQDNNAGLPVVYGERAVGGVKVWKGTQKSSFLPASGRTVLGLGDPNDGVDVDWEATTWLDRVDVLSEGPIHSVRDIIVDSDTYKAERFRERNHAIYRGIVMTGADGQGALTELSAAYPEWHTSSVGTNVAYVNSRFRAGHYSSDSYDSYFQGEPNCRYVVKGKLIYDPRKDTAYGGVGTHTTTDKSTWEWSDNPALCLLDYLTQPYGRNLDYSELRISTFITAANSCDEMVAIPPQLTNDTGSNVIAWNPVLGEWVDVATGEPLPNYRPDQDGLNQKRLTCNAVLDPSEGVLENVKTLLQSMRASLPYANGLYSLILEAPAASVMHIQPEDIIGGITFGNGDRSKRYNRVTVTFPNKNKAFNTDRVSWPALDSTEYTDFLADDNGEELFFEIQLDAITDYYQAEDIAEFICRDSRQQLQTEITVKSKAIMLQPGDVVGVSHPTPNWDQRYFRVRSLKVGTDLTVALSLAEYNTSTYDWANPNNEPDQPDVDLGGPHDPLPLVTDVQATVERSDTANGIPQGLVTLSWLPPAGEAPLEYITSVTKTVAGTSFEVRTSHSLTISGRIETTFVVPESGIEYTLGISYMTTSKRRSPVAVGTIDVPLYKSDIEIDQDNIQDEAGEILEFEDELGNIQPADLTDLAQYYKDQETEIDAAIDATNQTVTDQVTRLDADVAALNAQLTDITTGTADVYVQATAPVAGVGGVPDPIPTNTRWYDSDDNNHPYVWNGTSWTSIRDGGVGQNSNAITVLQSEMDAAEAGVSANATAIDVLDTTVTNIDGVVTTNASDITALEATVNNPTTGVAATSAAVNTLQTTTTTQGTDIATNATDITELQSTVNDPTTGVTATSGAVTALDTRVTATESGISTAAADITSLNSRVDDTETGQTANANAITGLSTQIETIEGEIDAIEISSGNITEINADWTYRTKIQSEADVDDDIDMEDDSGPIGLDDDPGLVALAAVQAQNALKVDIDQNAAGIVINSSDITTLNSNLEIAEAGILANADAVSTLETTVTQNAAGITVNSQDIVSLQSSLTDAEADIALNATAVSTLSTTVSNQGDELVSQASDITALEADLATAEGNITANASATDALTTRVTSAEGTIQSTSTSLTALQSQVTDVESDVAGNSTAVQGLSTRVTAAEGDITSQASDITRLETDLTTAEGNITANATAQSQLTTRVASVEGSVSSQSQQITALQSEVDNLDTASQADAISQLDTRVTDNEGDITVQAADITRLSASITDVEGDVTNAVSIANGASATANAANDGVTSLEAEWYVKANVNGVISGIEFKATEASSDFTIVANNFKVYNNTGSDIAPFSVSNNKVTMNGNVEVNGNLIVDGTISGNEIGNNAVGSDHLVISAGDGETGERMYFNGQDNRIEIFDSSNQLRVMLGDLT